MSHSLEAFDSRRRLASAVREAKRQMPDDWPGGFFLTDPGRTPAPWETVEHLPPGTGVIYRHFGHNDRFDTATKLRTICFKRKFPLLIANDPWLALRVGADGVHWPEAHAASARTWRHRFGFQTQSVHSASGMRSSVCDGILISTVFPSNSPSAGQAMGALKFRLLVKASARAVYALGGVNGQTAGSVSAAGGLAAIEGFL